MNRIFSKQFLTQFLILTGSRVIGALAAFAVSLIIARQFGASTLGQFSVLLAIVGILSAIASGGYPAIATVFSAKYKTKDQTALLKGYIRSGLIQALFGAAFSAVAVFVYHTSGAGGENSLTIVATIFIPLTVFATAIANFYGSVLIGLNRQVAGLLPDTLLKPIIFAGILLAAVAMGVPLNAVGVLVCFAIGSFTAAGAVAFNVARSKLLTGKNPSKENHRGWQKTAAPWIVTTLVWDLFIEIHIILAGWLAAPAEVAILHIVFRFRALAGYGMRALYALSLPDIVSANANGKYETVKALLLKANLLALVYSVFILTVFATAGGLMMGMFGPEFTAGWSLLVIVSSTMCIRALFGPAPAILAMTGHQKASAIVMLGCLVFSVVGSLILYPHNGLLGIAAPYTIANLFGSVFLAIYAKRVTGIDSSLISQVFQLKTIVQTLFNNTYPIAHEARQNILKN